MAFNYYMKYPQNFVSNYGKKFGGAMATYAGKKLFNYGAAKAINAVGRIVGRKTRYGRQSGFYNGPFAKPKRKGVKSPNQLQNCLSKGYAKTEELYGLVNDPHCVYVAHSTFHLDNYCKVIYGALLRKLFRKAGIDVSSSDGPIDLEGGAFIPVHRISVYVVYPDSGLQTVQTKTLSPGVSTLEGIISSSTTILDLFKDYITNNDANYEFSRMVLEVSDQETSSVTPDYDWKVSASMDLYNEHMHMFISSKLQIQNRTQGALATTDAGNLEERIDAQPLTGRLLSFSHGDPRFNELYRATFGPNKVYFINGTSNSGINLVRAEQLPSNFSEPLVPKNFANCNGASVVSLEPGMIKSCYLTYKFGGKLINVLKTMRVRMRDKASGDFDLNTGIRGKSQMLILEERIRTTSANKVTVSYEREYKIGCYFTTKKPTTIVQTYFSDSFNNTT